MKDDAMKVIKGQAKKLLELENLLKQRESALDKREKEIQKQAKILAAARKKNGKPECPELVRIIKPKEKSVRGR